MVGAGSTFGCLFLRVYPLPHRCFRYVSLPPETLMSCMDEVAESYLKRPAALSKCLVGMAERLSL